MQFVDFCLMDARSMGYRYELLVTNFICNVLKNQLSQSNRPDLIHSLESFASYFARHQFAV